MDFFKLEAHPPQQENNVYYLNLIKAGQCRVKDLQVAFQEKTINDEEHHALITLLAEHLERIATIEPLTGLRSLRTLESELQGLLEELNHHGEEKKKLPVKSVLIIYLDIEKFKRINDSYGHLVGNQALVEVANRLNKFTKKHDIKFRLHGDEFMVLLPLPDDNTRTAEEIFKRIKKDMNNGLSTTTQEEFKISMGYQIVHKGDTKSVADIVSAADSKMYENKNGR